MVLAPSERAVVDVLFNRAGRGRRSSTDARAHLPPRLDHGGEEPAEPSLAEQFGALRTNRDMAPSASGSRRTSTPRPTRRSPSSPRWRWASRRRPVVYACPMHPEVVQRRAGQLPGVRDEAAAGGTGGRRYTCPMHPEVVSDQPGHCPDCGMKLLPSQPGRRGRRPRARASRRPEGDHEHAHDAQLRPFRKTEVTTTPPRAASSGKTTWSRSTGSRPRRTCAGS